MREKLVSVDELYSKIAGIYGQGGMGEMLRTEEEEIEDLIPPLKGKNVLDVGCGTGRWTAKFSQQSGDVTGIEYNDEMLALARDSVDAKIMKGDARKLPFEDGSFDFVFSSLVLSHLKDWQTAAGEIHRVTRKGGYFGVSDMHGCFKFREDQAPFYKIEGEQYWAPSYPIYPSDLFGAYRGSELVEFREIFPSEKFKDMLGEETKEWVARRPIMFFMLYKKV